MLVGGAAWIVFISLFNVLILNHTPDWVRARVLAVSMLAFQGAMAAGSAVWGALATKTSIHAALMWAGLGTMVGASHGLKLSARLGRRSDAVDSLAAPHHLNQDPATAGGLQTPARSWSPSNTTWTRKKYPRSSRRSISLGASDGATAHTAGESFETSRVRTATWKYFW